MKKMGLALRDKQCFSHGQVYVAMSRVTTMGGIRVFSPNTKTKDGSAVIVNVVYHELLDGIQPRAQRWEDEALRKALSEQSVPDDFSDDELIELDMEIDMPY